MQHRATAGFWKHYDALTAEIRKRADDKFVLLKANHQHPSLQFKKVGDRSGHEIWSARISLSHRALALKQARGYLWFWIGDHNTYDSLLT